MKKLFKILGIVIVLILALMVVVPYFFRDQIVAKVKEEINKNVNAQVDFSGFSLSLFRNFPDFNFRLSGLSVINNEPFAGDTLAFIPKLSLTIDLMSVFKGEEYVIKKVDLDQPVFNFLVTGEGIANWDITIPSEEAEVPATEESPGLVIQLRQVTIRDARLVYDDKSLVTLVQIDGLDHTLSGDFTMDFTTLQTHTLIDEITVYYDHVKYLHRIDAELTAPVEADLKNYIFTFKDGDLRLNQFFLLFEGTFTMYDNGDYGIVFTYSTRKTDFKNFLSLVPAMYMTDFKNIKTAGTAVLNGNVKGVYSDVSYPGFELNILVNNGRFQYPDLPKSVDEINLDTKINFPGGADFDALTVDVSNLSLFMGGNKFALSMFLSNPVSDMYMKGEVDGVINLSEVKDFYPLEEGDELKGKMTAKLLFDGRMSAIENERYQDFKLLGSMLLESFAYKTGMVKEEVEIANAQMNFSPEYIDLVNFDIKIGKNDLSASGKVENFLPYAFADGILTGNLQLSSNYLNVTDILVESEEPETTVTDTAALSVIEIPGNIDFTLQSTFKTVIYNQIDLKNVEGNLLVKNQALLLDKLNMEVLDGTIGMSGKYDTKDPEKPRAEFDMNLNGIDIQKSYSTFGTIEKFAPIAAKTSGKFSAALSVKTLLDNQLMPIYSSMNGGGNLSTSDIIIENVNSVNKIADLLKMPDLKRLSLNPVRLSFEFIDGKAHVKPFDIKYQDINANVLGWVSFDQSIDFDMVLAIPRAKFGGAANAVLDNLLSEANKLGTNFSVGDKIDVRAKISGTTSDPNVKLFPGEGSGQSMMDDLKKRAQEELDRQKQRLEEEARKELEKQKSDAKAKADQLIADANKQAAKIIEEAQKQADAINKTARETAEKVKEEANKQADKLIQDSKSKGMVAEIAGKKAAEQLRKEADKQAGQIVTEAQKQSDNLIREAQNQADKIKADARNQADKLIDGI
ncbi:MAG: hypothetical protein IH598_11980 [Bacteroidales bacterium]|nr:hypothetical protein [Bacteroidales bacterium]